MFELKLPELGENIETAEVIRLLVSEGETITVQQNVLELESEKAAFPLPATVGGKVAKIRVKAGDSVSVGQTLLEIEEAAAGRPSDAGLPAETATIETTDGKQRKDKEWKASAAKTSAEAYAGEPEMDEAEAVRAAERVSRGRSPTRTERADVPADRGDIAGDERQRERERKLPAATPATRRLARELGVIY